MSLIIDVNMNKFKYSLVTNLTKIIFIKYNECPNTRGKKFNPFGLSDTWSGFIMDRVSKILTKIPVSEQSAKPRLFDKKIILMKL